MDTIPNEPSLESAEAQAQKHLDEFFAAEYLERDGEKYARAYDELSRALVLAAGYDPGAADINNERSSKTMFASVEIVNFEERTGAYRFEILIRDKFADGSHIFKKDMVVSSAILERYLEKRRKDDEENDAEHKELQALSKEVFSELDAFIAGQPERYFETRHSTEKWQKFKLDRLFYSLDAGAAWTLEKIVHENTGDAIHIKVWDQATGEGRLTDEFEIRKN